MPNMAIRGRESWALTRFSRLALVLTCIDLQLFTISLVNLIQFQGATQFHGFFETLLGELSVIPFGIQFFSTDDEVQSKSF